MPRKKLVDGFNRFKDKFYQPDGKGLMDKLAREGAWPDFFIINCIDPRNGADIVFDALPGQQFAHSKMAAIIPPFDKDKQPGLNASLSYAAENKKIKHLIIMGHSQCGGVSALVHGTDDPYIKNWMSTAAEARKAAEAKAGTADLNALQRETEQQVVIMSYKNVLEYPMVKKAVQEGRLTVNGWFFDMEKGTLLEYKPDKGTFEQISGMTYPKQQASFKNHKKQKKKPHNPPSPPGMAA